MSVLIFSILDSDVFYRNFGAYRIVHQLRQNGISGRVIEFLNKMTTGELRTLLNRVLNDNVKIVGFSTTFGMMFLRDYGSFSNSELQQKIQMIISECRIRGIKVVFGGHHARTYAEIFDHDVAFYGFSDTKFLSYCYSILNNTDIEIDHTDVLDTSFDFDNTPSLFTKEDLIFDGEILPFELSRGCIFKCKFCASPMLGKKKNTFIKSKQVIQQELLSNYQKFGTTRYVILDETFNETIEKMQHFYDAIVELPFYDQLEFGGYLRLDLIASNFDQQIDLLHKIKYNYTQYGIEALNDEAGRSIGKGMPTEKILQCLSDIKEYKARTGYDFYQMSGFIIGLPFEQMDVFKQRLDFICENGLLEGIQINPLVLNDPNKTPFASEFAKNISKYGFKQLSEKNKTIWLNSDTQAKSSQGAVVMANNLSTYVHEKYHLLKPAAHRTINILSLLIIMNHIENRGLTIEEMKNTAKNMERVNVGRELDSDIIKLKNLYLTRLMSDE